MSPRSPATRTDILRAARAMIETKPFSDVTMSSIATAAGVSRQAVYLHFQSRTRLLLELVAWADESGRLPELIVAAARLTDPVEALLAGIRAAAVYNSDIAAIGLALRAARHADAAAARAWDDRMASRLSGIGRFIQPVQDAGRLRPEWNASTATDAVFALTSLALYEELVLDRGWSIKSYADHMTSIARHVLIEPRYPGTCEA